MQVSKHTKFAIRKTYKFQIPEKYTKQAYATGFLAAVVVVIFAEHFLFCFVNGINLIELRVFGDVECAALQNVYVNESKHKLRIVFWFADHGKFVCP